MASFHLEILQEAEKETSLCYTENTGKKKNAVTHELRWEYSLGLEPACLRIFAQPHDVT